MGVGIIVLFFFGIFYCFFLFIIFSKRNNKHQKILIVALPFSILLCFAVYGFIDDFTYHQKLKKYPQFTHLTFLSPISEVKASIRELTSVINVDELPYLSSYNPVSFDDLRTGKYPLSDSAFTDTSIALKNFSFLEKNGIHALTIIGKKVFVTYQDSISKKERFRYQFLQLEGVTKDRTKFLPNQFDTVDHKEGLYLLREIPLN